MLFNSVEFLLFAIILIPIYWALPRIGQNLLLLAASYYFYGSVHGWFLGLIVVSTVIDYTMARLIDRDRKRATLYLLISIAANLGILGYFKYCNFFLENFSQLLGQVGLSMSYERLSIILPVGISFYTFQTMAYTIDVARQKIRSYKNPLHVALYVAFFPQLVAGPIERAERLLPQFEQRRVFHAADFYRGLYLILFGLFKKIVVADNVAVQVDVIFGLDNPPPGLILVGTLAFAVQIYADFSGYSDIARGVAKLLGIDLMRNFNLPYFAISPSDFWRRWHISLSEWIRDYLYIPLGGNRKGNIRRNVNVLTAMTLSGLWHGASVNFILWGAYHAIALILFEPFDRLMHRLRWRERTRHVVGWAVTFGIVMYGWLLFRIQDFGYLAHLHSQLLATRLWDVGVVEAAAVLGLIAVFVIPLFAYEQWQHRRSDTESVTHAHWGMQVAVCTFLLFACVVFGVESSESFIYFQF